MSVMLYRTEVPVSTKSFALLLYGKYGEGKFAKVSEEDIDYVLTYRWYLTKSGSVKSSLDMNKKIHLHRLIAGRMFDLKDFKIEHIDRNKMNCCRSNLRKITQQQLSRKTAIYKNNKTGVKGVSLNKISDKYRASISINKTTKHLGYFTSLEEARSVRKLAEKQYFGI